MFKKLIFFFAWIGIFIISIASLNYILLPGRFIFLGSTSDNIYIFQYLVSIFEIKMLGIILSAIYVFLCLCKFASMFERKKDYEKKTENGILKISRSTVNNYVIDLLKRDNEISGVKVNSELKGNKFLVYIKCEIDAVVNVVNKINEIQDRVKENLKEGVGVEVNKVVVDISKMSTKEKVEETPTVHETPEVEVNS